MPKTPWRRLVDVDKHQSAYVTLGIPRICLELASEQSCCRFVFCCASLLVPSTHQSLRLTQNTSKYSQVDECLADSDVIKSVVC